MKVLVLAGLFGLSIAVAAGATPAAVWDTYRQLYPDDPAKRQALDTCFLSDTKFDRFDPAARAACYRHFLTSARPASVPPPNFVDLRQAAGFGQLQQNDVRFQELNRRYIRLLSGERPL